jgi:hypothetical protein
MPPRGILRFRHALLAIAMILPQHAATPACAEETAASIASLIAEARKSFTLHGKPPPPEIFRDFGDGDLADSGAIWVTVDLLAAIGSNLYDDDISAANGWISQKKAAKPVEETTAYKYVGATENGLLIVLAAYSGGGSGDFVTLHVLDVSAGRGFDPEGKPYTRINLTNLRSAPLGDRWEGETTIARNQVRIVTKRRGPADDSGRRETLTIDAVRPW